MKNLFIAGLLTIIIISCNRGKSEGTVPAPSGETQYLIFQLFTYNPSSNGYTQPFDGISIRNQVDEILTAVENNRGNGSSRQLGFAVGPLSFDHTDDQLRTIIRQSFVIAEEKNVAVVFHIDESMFWINRTNLWSNPANVEWSDWNGTVVQHRYISWAPVVLAPQMCYNSPVIKEEVQRIVKDIIGAEIKKGIDDLKSKNKERLFAGVIAGWETHLADNRYIDKNDQVANQLNIPRVSTGYHALTNLGYSPTHLPANVDSILERVVHDFADFWAIQLGETNIPANRIYTHFSYPVLPSGQAKQMLDQLSIQLGFKTNILGFTHTAPATAFNIHSRPGFSTYPIGFKENGIDGQLSKIVRELPNHGNPPWASAEGTNIQVGTGTSPISWNEYLSGLFNNGAALVNIFAWSNPGIYGTSTKSQEAITAYKKFLNGGF